MNLPLFRAYLEIAYFLSGVFVAVVAVIGLRQLRLLKADIVMRNTRAAREKALEAAGRYLTETVAASGNLYYELKKKGLPTEYKGRIGDFSFKSLSLDWCKKAGLARMGASGVLPELNSMEMVAAMFVSGVADSDTGFKIIGRSFCAGVEARYDIIAMCRQRSGTHYDFYSSIVDLHKVWASQFSADELAQARKDIETRMAGIAELKLDSIAPQI